MLAGVDHRHGRRLPHRRDRHARASGSSSTIASFGLGVAAYAICWLAFPSDEHPAPLSEIRHDPRGRAAHAGFVVGLVLLGIGLDHRVRPAGRGPFRHGGSVVWATVPHRRRRSPCCCCATPTTSRRPPPAARPADARPPAPTPARRAERPTPTPRPPSRRRPAGRRPSAPTDPTTRHRRRRRRRTRRRRRPPAPPLPPIPPSAWTQSAPWPTAPPPRVRTPRRARSSRRSRSACCSSAAASCTLLDDNGTAHLTAAEILAGGSCVVGLALVLSTWFGRAHGLIPIGDPAARRTLPAATIDVPLTGGIGNHDYRPITRSEIAVELRDRHRPARRSTCAARRWRATSTRIHAQLGIGEMVVDVPTHRAGRRARARRRRLGPALRRATTAAGPRTQTRTAPGTEPACSTSTCEVGAGDIDVRRFDARAAPRRSSPRSRRHRDADGDSDDQHPTDLVALLFGLAFTIAGVIVARRPRRPTSTSARSGAPASA